MFDIARKYVAPLNDARMFSGAAVLSDGVMVVGAYFYEIYISRIEIVLVKICRWVWR